MKIAGTHAILRRELPPLSIHRPGVLARPNPPEKIFREYSSGELRRAHALPVLINGLDRGLEDLFPTEKGGVTNLLFQAAALERLRPVDLPIFLAAIAIRDANSKRKKSVATSAGIQIQEPFVPSIDFLDRLRDLITRPPLSIKLERIPYDQGRPSGLPWEYKCERADDLNLATEAVLATLRGVFYPERAPHRLLAKAVRLYGLIADDEVMLSGMLHARNLDEHADFRGIYPIVPSEWALEDFKAWRGIRITEQQSIGFYGIQVREYEASKPAMTLRYEIMMSGYVIFREAIEGGHRGPLAVVTAGMFGSWLLEGEPARETVLSVTLQQVLDFQRERDQTAEHRKADRFLVVGKDVVGLEAKRRFEAGQQNANPPELLFVTEGGGKRGPLVAVLEPRHILPIR